MRSTGIKFTLAVLFYARRLALNSTRCLDTPDTGQVHSELLGKVHPQQGGWRLENIQEFHGPHGITRVAVHASSAIVTINGPDPDDFGTYLNEVRSDVGAIIDSLGFELAIPLRFEPTHAIVNGEDPVFIHAGWPALLEHESGPNGGWVRGEQLSPIVAATVENPLIRLAVADAQRAIEMPDDTGFYCYRSIESLRLIFLQGDKDDGTARSESWHQLRTKLGLSRDEVVSIKNLADQRRHGGYQHLTEANRQSCLLTTRRAIRSAINLASADRR